MLRSGIIFSPALLLVIISCGSGSGAPEPVTLPGELTVDDFSLAWERQENTISFTMSAPTTGWVAVGFEPSSAMKDADIIIGYVSDGVIHISDDWGDGFITHSPDTAIGGTSDLISFSGSEENGATEIAFEIPLNSGDAYDRDLSETITRKVILAYGPDGADDFQGYHAWAETVEMEF